MIYNYFCEDNECTFAGYKNSDADGFVVKLTETDNIGEQLLVWEVSHGMMESPDVRCPVCGGKASKHLAYNAGNFYIRGNCYLNKDDCRRQMDLHYLDGKDEDGNPLNTYDEHYEPGEKDHIRDTLKRGGKPAPMISSVVDKKKAVNESKKKYVESILTFLDKDETEVEVKW